MYNFDQIQSLGHKKGFLFFNRLSEITPRDDYIVVKTLNNDKHISGNFVLFKNPPSELSVSEWPTIFKKEFGNNSNIKHILLGWENNSRKDQVLENFKKDGFALVEFETLVLKRLTKPSCFNENIFVREISYHEDWPKIVKQQMLFRPTTLSIDYYEEFNKKLMDGYSELLKKGNCKWFGAYLQNKLVGSLGILWSDEIVGFQRVVVDREYWRQGICSTLMYSTTEWILKSINTTNIVIWAKQNSIASKIYRSCGYDFHEELLALLKHPGQQTNLAA